MRRFLIGLWQDDAGDMGVEWAFLATVLVLGAVTGAILTQPTEPPGEEGPPARVLR